MKKIATRSPLLILPVSLLTVAMFFPMSSPLRAQTQDALVIEITAKKYEYSNLVHVQAGTKVQLKITAIDHDHGFKISPVPDGAGPNSAGGLIFTSAEDCWQLKKGQATTIEFLAKTPGTYSFK